MQAKQYSTTPRLCILAYSNARAPYEVLVRRALEHGAFHFILEAVLEFGLAFVLEQWAHILADEEAAPTARAQADIIRKLTNIERGLRAAWGHAEAMGPRTPVAFKQTAALSVKCD